MTLRAEISHLQCTYLVAFVRIVYNRFPSKLTLGKFSEFIIQQASLVVSLRIYMNVFDMQIFQMQI